MAQKKNKWGIWALVAFVVILIVIAAIKGGNRNSATKVDYATVEERYIIQSVQASGRIYPEKEVKISSDVSGEIFNLSVKEGDSVQTGDFLAQIDPEAIESQVQRGQAAVSSARAQKAQSEASAAQAEAQVEQAKAQLNTQIQIHNRNEQLFKEEVISQQELEQSQLNLDNAKANLKSAEAQLKSAQKAIESASYNIQSAVASLKELKTSLERTTINAPTDGIVSKLNVEEGERVVGTIQMAGTELMRIANFSSMEVRVEVSENDILRVEVGNEVDIEVDAYLNQTFKGIVTEIASSAADIGTAASGINTEQVTNFIVKIRILPESYQELLSKENAYAFRPGMTANVEIKTQTVPNALSVPIGAVTTRDKKNENKAAKKDDDYLQVVFVVESDTVNMTEVETGIQDGDYIQITKGLQKGQTVVSGPFNAVFKTLKEGDSVQEKENKKEEKES